MYTSSHVEKLRAIYTGRKVSDFIDQLNVDFIEDIIAENRLTARSSVALGIGALDYFKEAKDKYNVNNARILGLKQKVTSLCAQLLNMEGQIESIRAKGGSDDAVCEAMKAKCEKRGNGAWSQVNIGTNNLEVIDALLQYSEELVILLDLQKDDSKTSLSDGSDR
ncbi:MAG: hypothetical protein WCQ49_02100 [Candidatus Saccharibacteria bacterium]